MGNKSKNRMTYHHVRKNRAIPNNIHIGKNIDNISETQIPPQDVSFFRITNLKAMIIIATVGIVTFFTGLQGAFMDDDQTQIVNNPVVHSLSNIFLFFQGSTFYNGGGIAPLAGEYYRPMMTTVFSFIYSFFGLNPIAYHIFQIVLCILSATLIFFIFRYYFHAVLALVLALVFLVHPLNSQVAFAIPTTQDALFMFFGCLAIWTLHRFKSTRSVFFAVICLFLSLLSKESGILFVAIALLYLYIFSRKRLWLFVKFMIMPVIIYIALKINAVGFFGESNIAPIDNLNTTGRILTIPSVIFFYITKFVFPWELASAYYWTNPSFSFVNVLLPLIIDLIVIGIFIYIGRIIYKQKNIDLFKFYLFFGAWPVLGLLPYLGILPLDMTACQTWFYFPMVGILGMLGVIYMAFRKYVNVKWLLTIVIVIVIVFGIRTSLWGLAWNNIYSRASQDIVASKENYVAYADLARYYGEHNNYDEAKKYILQSIAAYPTYGNYGNLGLILSRLGDYPEAINAYKKGMEYGAVYTLYENMGEMTLIYGDPTSNQQFLEEATRKFPQNCKIWTYLALFEQSNGDNISAKESISEAIKYGSVPKTVYSSIIDNQPFSIYLSGVQKTIYIQ